MGHVFIDDRCVFCGGGQQAAPCQKDPKTLREAVIYAVKRQLVRYGWGGGSVDWHVAAHHMAETVYTSMDASRSGLEVTFTYGDHVSVQYMHRRDIADEMERVLICHPDIDRVSFQTVPGEIVPLQQLVANVMYEEAVSLGMTCPHIGRVATDIAREIKQWKADHVVAR
jgi:hypothetical protein